MICKHDDDWAKTSTQVFWGEIAPCEHVVQIYEDDQSFLTLLAGFVADGFQSSESVVIIATDAHLESLNCLLEEMGHDVNDHIRKNQYTPLDAERTLAKFMVNDWPDQTLFNYTVEDVIQTAKTNGRKVRAFGEMVALLWVQGQVGATVRLEQLWNSFCENQAFSLFCAYPKSGFTQDASESLMHICGAHTKMITGVVEVGKPQIFYKDVQHHRAG